jgi:hypothetical protein
MTNQSFRPENRMHTFRVDNVMVPSSPDRVEFECPNGYSLIKEKGYFILTGKQHGETYGVLFREDLVEDTLKEIRRQTYDEENPMYWVGLNFRDIIRKHLVEKKP